MCEEISDETLEPIAMGPAVDPLIQDHISRCIHCHARFLECQDWARHPSDVD